MNLQSFVEKSIVEIVNGIANAQQSLVTSGAIINPFLSGVNGHPIEKIKFDVAVEASTGSETKGGGSINVLGGFMRAKGEIGLSEKENTVSRISFTVPVCLPPPSAGRQE